MSVHLSNSARLSNPGIYNRREPEKTPLYQAVLGSLEQWLCMHWDDPVPAYAEGEFRKFLKCGILAFGFARVRCSGCGYELIVAFSCKCRGVCPSCGTRRMDEIAAHLVDHVLPPLAVRQWVLDVPKRLRWHIHRNAELCGKVLKIFMDEVERKLIQSSGAPATAQMGGVTFIQRFGSTLNVHPHYHSCVIDGVFAAEDGGVKFYPAKLENGDIYSVEIKVQRRVLRLFALRGILTRDEVTDMLRWTNGGGFSLDATVCIKHDDRAGLERLIRYCARPPFSGSRLRAEADGKLLYIPQKPGPHGRGLMSLTPVELLEKLSHLIPPPRRHRHHYHGVLAASARLRSQVIALALKHAKITRSDCPKPLESELYKPKASYRWAALLARVFEIWPLICPRCKGEMKIIAFIEEPEVIVQILTHIGEPHAPPVPTPASGPWCDIWTEDSSMEFEHSVENAPDFCD